MSTPAGFVLCSMLLALVFVATQPAGVGRGIPLQEICGIKAAMIFIGHIGEFSRSDSTMQERSPETKDLSKYL